MPTTSAPTNLTPTADNRPSSALFDAGGVARRERFEYQRELYRGFAELEVDAAHRADFWARSETWRLGPFVLTDGVCTDMRFRRMAAHCACRLREIDGESDA